MQVINQYKPSLLIRFSLFVIAFSLQSALFAQNENEIVEDSLFDISTSKVHFDMAFTFKTQNYFRGLLPSGAPTLATNAGVIWDNWIFAMYGGVGIDGVYQETDFILIYQRPRIEFRLEYYYNFTQGITDIPTPSGLFDFNRLTTRGLLDFIVNASIDKEKHWNVNSSTFLFGRDTDIEERGLPGDPILVRTDQRYSQYFELAYNWYNRRYKVEALVGGSFSWANPSGPMFYGDGPGINNIGVNLTRQFLINEKVKIPIKASAYLNPMAETTFLLLSVKLIQFSKI